jgi:predicted SprT family Zn-dependent metalloprotease
MEKIELYLYDLEIKRYQNKDEEWKEVVQIRWPLASNSGFIKRLTEKGVETFVFEPKPGL